MGTSNAAAAYALYAGKIPPTSLNVLVWMALGSLDRDTEPWWSQGHEILAIRCLGAPEPVTDASLRAVRRAITPLFNAGAITVERRSSGHGTRKIAVRYRLWLTEPAPDENRPVHNQLAQDGKRPTRTTGTGRKPTCTEAGVGRKVVAAPDGNRPPKEYEENLKQERDLKAGAPAPVDDTRTGNAHARGTNESRFTGNGRPSPWTAQETAAEARRQADRMAETELLRDAAPRQEISDEEWERRERIAAADVGPLPQAAP